jgi:phosphoglycolate phosphatase-like HAD superfamily hydrolase
VDVINPNLRRGGFRAAVFDFDGTLSLVREGWARIMAEMGRDLFREQGLSTGPDGELLAYLEEQMLRLSGKPSIYQMRNLAAIVAERGGTPPDPDALLQEYLRRLHAVIDVRTRQLATGEALPDTWAVPGSREILENLRRRGVALYLASGTDLKHVRAEAELLKLTEFFGPHIYAPEDNTPNFAKRDVFEMILRERRIDGAQLLSFGDGYSETVEAKRAGGAAIGVASAEAGAPGLNRMKRDMLRELGADVIVPDYRRQCELVTWLFAE